MRFVIHFVVLLILWVGCALTVKERQTVLDRFRQEEVDEVALGMCNEDHLRHLGLVPPVACLFASAYALAGNKAQADAYAPPSDLPD